MVHGGGLAVNIIRETQQKPPITQELRNLSTIQKWLFVADSSGLQFVKGRRPQSLGWSRLLCLSLHHFGWSRR